MRHRNSLGSEARAVDALVADHGDMPILVAAILTMSVAQLLDLATFSEMMRRVGAAAEVNPIVATLFGIHGLPLVAIAKVALLALVTAIVAMLAASPARRVAVPIMVVVLAVAIAAGLLGGATNTAAIGLL
jgi:hypothetical protein